MSISRLLARPQVSRAPGINQGLERELNSIRQQFGKWPVESVPGMAQLIDERGERERIVTMQFALYFCTLNPEWGFEAL
jgi:hypothetical protein